MADAVSSLAAFEERNVFGPLQSFNDESIPDVEVHAISHEAAAV